MHPFEAGEIVKIRHQELLAEAAGRRGRTVPAPGARPRSVQVLGHLLLGIGVRLLTGRPTQGSLSGARAGDGITFEVRWGCPRTHRAG